MRDLKRRIVRLEEARQSSVEKPTHFLDIEIRTATDEQLDAMVVLNNARSAVRPLPLIVADGSPELAQAVAYLAATGAVFPADIVVG